MIKLKVKLVKNFKDKTIGLIGQTQPKPILFFTRFGIHTFGLKFPIDVVILNKNDEVVKLKENLRPNRIFLWPVQYNKVLELPQGFIKKNKIKISRKIILSSG